MAQEPLKSLMNNPNVSAYVFFGLEANYESECTAFLTPRAQYKVRESNETKRSRPILLKSDGSTISPTELWSHGWNRKVLYSGHNASNAGRLEKLNHEKNPSLTSRKKTKQKQRRMEGQR